MNPEWKLVATALLGSWPQQVSAWGREALAAYIDEIAARDISADQALIAIRSCPADQKFPPSVAELSALARRDVSVPTFSEALALIQTALRAGNQPLRGDFSTEAQMIGARQDMVRARAAEMHPLVASFIARYGVGRLQDDVGELDGEHGGIRRRDLERDWDAHCGAMEDRELALIASGRRGELGRLDPLAVLGLGGPAQIGAGDRS